jgi:hypothetical protein
VSNCDHPHLYAYNQFGQMDRVSPCLYCERDAAWNELAVLRRADDARAAVQPDVCPHGRPIAEKPWCIACYRDASNADQQFGCTTTGAGLVQPGHCPKCGWQWDHHGGYGHCPVTLADKSSDAPARRRDLDED